MGKINFVRRFISDFARMVKPIHNLLRQDQAFSWNDTTEKDFVDIKNAISSAPVLAKPDFSKILSYILMPLKKHFCNSSSER
jgi:hypothetical protein